MLKLDCNHHVKSFTKEEAMVSDEEWRQPISDQPAGFKKGNYTFCYDYPLNTEAQFMHELTPEMTWIDLLLLAKADYEEIYRREDAACGPTGNIPGMLNRASSNGPYGIWGHDISDLYFERVMVNDERFTVEFFIGS